MYLLRDPVFRSAVFVHRENHSIEDGGILSQPALMSELVFRARSEFEAFSNLVAAQKRLEKKKA